jgi:RHS repeat-associated protein
VLSKLVQPVDKNYATFTSATVSLAAGSYTLTITGLNPYGGDNTAFVDAVKLNGTLVSNGGFETPALASGGWVYQPSGATWTFTGTSGIAKNNSAFTSTNPVAPEGTQVAILQESGRATHPLSLAAGNFSFSLQAAQRGSINSSSQQLLVTIDGSAQLIQSTKQFIWNGNTMAEERDASNVVTRRFYSEGEQISGTSYYYTRDHLGSVREMAGPAGAIHAQYDYNMFGVRAKVQGDLDASLGFTGHYYHAPSGLYLTLYRAYDPLSNRWLSRDRLEDAEMSQGPNLYAYVGNDALNLVDPLGLALGDWWDLRTWFNRGFTDSLGMTWTSLQDVTGDVLTGNLDRLAGDAGGNPLGQTENCPAAYATEWGLLGTSFTAAGGTVPVNWWNGLSPGAKFAVVNALMNILTGEGDPVEPFRPTPKIPPNISGP